MIWGGVIHLDDFGRHGTNSDFLIFISEIQFKIINRLVGSDLLEKFFPIGGVFIKIKVQYALILNVFLAETGKIQKAEVEIHNFAVR